MPRPKARAAFWNKALEGNVVGAFGDLVSNPKLQHSYGIVVNREGRHSFLSSGTYIDFLEGLLFKACYVWMAKLTQDQGIDDMAAMISAHDFLKGVFDCVSRDGASLFSWLVKERSRAALIIVMCAMPEGTFPPEECPRPIPTVCEIRLARNGDAPEHPRGTPT